MRLFNIFLSHGNRVDFYISGDEQAEAVVKTIQESIKDQENETMIFVDADEGPVGFKSSQIEGFQVTCPEMLGKADSEYDIYREIGTHDLVN